MKMNEVTEKELLDTYMVQSESAKVTSWSRFISLDDGSKEQYTGTLTWDADDGYRMYWYDGHPKMAERPEFEYVLDCITNRGRIPQYGDLSDAGMDGA
jgi:hypothetical protein